MKEATGELSTTVITVVAIAAISTLFIVFLYPQLKASVILNQACGNGGQYSYASSGAAPQNANFQAPQNGYGVWCDAKAQNANNWTCTFREGNNTRTKTCTGS